MEEANGWGVLRPDAKRSICTLMRCIQFDCNGYACGEEVTWKWASQPSGSVSHDFLKLLKNCFFFIKYLAEKSEGGGEGTWTFSPEYVEA